MFTQVSNIVSFGRKKVIGPKCAFPPSYSISFPVFLNCPSFQGNSQWILGCIPPSLRVAGRCSSGCSEGLWSKYPNALLELMSKKYSITANLKVEKSFLATTAIYTPAELCNAQGTFPSISHRFFHQPSEASRADTIIFSLHRKVYVQGMEQGFELWPSGSGIFLWYMKHTINLKRVFFSSKVNMRGILDWCFICSLHYQIFQSG